jgi:hypothetical protein
MSNKVCWVAVFAILAAAGCSDSADSPATTDSGVVADTAPNDAATGDTGSDTGTVVTDSAPAETGDPCTAVANTGASVSKTTNAVPTPMMTGGTIVDGTYVLTKWDLYNGETGTSTHKETFVFAAGKGQRVGSTDGGADKAIFFDYATSGTNAITLTLTCGGMGTVATTYSATATTFVFASPSNKNQVQTFTKK